MLIQSLLGSVILLAAGAVIGFVPTHLNERAKRQHDLATRWDVPLYDLCKQFVAAARQVRHLARRPPYRMDDEARFMEITLELAKLRMLAQQLRLIGSRQLQEAARDVQEHAYVMGTKVIRRSGPEPAGHLMDDDEGRLRRALRGFYVAARVQLGVRDPESLSADILPGFPAPADETRPLG
jgi:hypothetical protein